MWNLKYYFQINKNCYYLWKYLHINKQNKCIFWSHWQFVNEKKYRPWLANALLWMDVIALVFFPKPSFTCYTIANSISKFNVTYYKSSHRISDAFSLGHYIYLLLFIIKFIRTVLRLLFRATTYPRIFMAFGNPPLPSMSTWLMDEPIISR